jgi:uncharacterized protein YoxC
MTAIQEIMVYLFPSVITAVFALIIQRYKRVEKKVENFDKKFETVNSNISSIKTDIVREIGNLKNHIAENYVPNKRCEQIAELFHNVKGQ